MSISGAGRALPEQKHLESIDVPLSHLDHKCPALNKSSLSGIKIPLILYASLWRSQTHHVSILHGADLGPSLRIGGAASTKSKMLVAGGVPISGRHLFRDCSHFLKLQVLQVDHLETTSMSWLCPQQKPPQNWKTSSDPVGKGKIASILFK